MSHFELSGVPASLAEALRKYRLLAGFSQKSVAEALGITRSAYTYYETGKTSPDPTTLNRIAKMFGVPLEVFFVDGIETIPDELYLHDSGATKQRAPREIQAEPQRIGDLTADEKMLVAYLRGRNIPGERVLDLIKQLYDVHFEPNSPPLF